MAISSPLRQVDISYFSFVRRFVDGSRINLSTIPTWFNEYYNEKLYIDSAFEYDINSYVPGLMFCLQDHTLKISKYAYEHYDSGHGVVIIEKINNGIDFFFLSGTTVHNGKFLNFCINNVEVLKKFTSSFKDQAHALLTTAEKNKFHFMQNSNQTAAHAMVNLASVPSLAKNSTSYKKELLTKRENSVAAHLLQGKTAKEIGRALLISDRTVEIHLEHIRAKLNCRNKGQIVYKLMSLQSLAAEVVF